MTGQHHQHLFNYHDAVIYPSDLGILDSPSAWLNDAVIHFHMTRLQHRRRHRGKNPKERMDESDSDDDSSDTENLFLDP